MRTHHDTISVTGHSCPVVAMAPSLCGRVSTLVTDQLVRISMSLTDRAHEERSLGPPHRRLPTNPNGWWTLTARSLKATSNQQSSAVRKPRLPPDGLCHLWPWAGGPCSLYSRVLHGARTSMSATGGSKIYNQSINCSVCESIATCGYKNSRDPSSS